MSYHKYLSWNDRLKIEVMLRHGISKKEMAAELGCCLKTIYNELSRGAVQLLNGDTYEFYPSYSADIAQQKFLYAQTAKGRSLALGKHYDYVAKVSYYIREMKYSPDVIVHVLRAAGEWTVSTATLYRYIDAGYIPGVSNSDLLEKPQQKKDPRPPRASRASAGTSIEKRPAEINSRKTVGHWEMDSVIGKAKGLSESMLTMVERKSLLTLLRKVQDKTAAESVRVLSPICRDYLVRSVTVDNGSEFSDCYGMEHNPDGSKRLDMYYCHPYCSCERPSNERMNRMVRRFFPKGVSLAAVTQDQCDAAEAWLNNYPRRSLGYRTPLEVYSEAIASLHGAEAPPG